MILARIYLLLCVVFWGWSFVATKICLQYVSPVELLGLRFLIGIPLLFLIIVTKRLRFEFTGREKLSILLGSTVLTFHFLIQITALKYTSATNTGWIISVSPLVMVLLAYLLHKERIGRRGAVGIVVATLGILLLVSGGNLSDLSWLSSFGDWLVLVSAHTWAIYTVVVRDVARSRHPLTVTLAVLLPSSAVVLLWMALFSDWTRFLHLPADGLWALLFLGLLGLAVAHWFWQEGVARLGASRAGLYLYIEPLATTGLAIPLLGERLGVVAAIGGLLVLAGVYWAERRQSSRGRVTPPAQP